MQTINARVLDFPDGTQRLHYSTRPRNVKDDAEKERDREYRNKWKEYQDYLFQNDFPMYVELFGRVEEEKSEDYLQRVRQVALKRAKQSVYDIARSNSFDLFLTLTFDPLIVDSFDYSAVVDKLESFTKFLRRHGSQYVLVPEKHESGRYHFHGLCTRCDIELSPATNAHNGELLYDKSGRQIFNLPQYSLGFSTATFVSDPAKTASYLCKYLTKEIEVPKGKKCYWASRSCSRPSVSYAYVEDNELSKFVEDCRFVKVTSNEYGEFLIAENHNSVL